MFLGLVAGATSLSLGTLCAQSDAEMNQLKAQMQQMQQEYEKRLAAMESQVKSMQSQVALTASVAKSRTITGPDGKAISMEGPVLMPAFDTFTRNFKWHGYIRAGTGFTANGVGQTFNFNTPDVAFGKTQRLGNENDFYVETGPILDHMLGDDPDVIDARVKMTFQFFDGVDKQVGLNLDNDGWGAGLVECYLEMKNVIKSAPEVTFWGGQRFYDRYDIHPSDYFFLNTSGIGAGAYNIPLGPGSLAIAYFGGIKSGTGTFFLDDTSFDNFTLDVDGGTGDFYRHVLDLRWGDVDFLGGKLKLVLIGSYQHGGDFTIAYNDGTTGQGEVENSGGVGGGIVQQWDLPPNWGKLSFIQVGLLYGWGLVDFDPSGVNLDKLNNSYLSALAADGSYAQSGWYLRMVRSRKSTPTTIASRVGRTSSGCGIRQITSRWAPGHSISIMIRALPATRSSMETFRVQKATTISLVPASGLTTGCGVPSRFRPPPPTPISRTIGVRAQALAMEVRWASSRSRRPSNPAAASSPVLSCAPLRPSPYGPTSLRAPLDLQPTPKRTTAGSSVSKLRPGSRAPGAI